VFSRGFILALYQVLSGLPFLRNDRLKKSGIHGKIKRYICCKKQELIIKKETKYEN